MVPKTKWGSSFRSRPADVVAPRVVSPQRASTVKLGLLAAALMLTAVAAGLWMTTRQKAAARGACPDTSDLRFRPDSRTGELKQLTTSADDRAPSLSADGKTLVFSSNRTGNTDVWIKDLASGRETALTATPVNEDLPKVTLDGRKVAYATANEQGLPFYADVVSAGGGVPERVCEDCGLLWGWSSDGRWILFGEGAVRFVGPIDTAAAKKADFLKHPRYSLVQPQLSPDDKWIVVIAADVAPGRTQVLLVPRIAQVTPAGDEWIPVTDGSTFEDKPRWSPDGRMIYFTSDRDGFRCLWAQRLEPTTGIPPALRCPCITSIRHGGRC